MVTVLTVIVLFLSLIVCGMCVYIRWQMRWPNIFKMFALIFGKSTIQEVSETTRMGLRVLRQKLEEAEKKSGSLEEATRSTGR